MLTPALMMPPLLQRGAEEAADRAGDKLSEAKGKAGKAAEEARDSAAGGWFSTKVRGLGADTGEGCLAPQLLGKED